MQFKQRIESERARINRQMCELAAAEYFHPYFRSNNQNTQVLTN